MFFNSFPLELKELIIFSITDKKTILNSRLVCKDWYDILYKVKEKSMEHRFFDNKYISKNIKLNLIIREINFKPYGKYIYKEYLDNGIIKKKIETFPPYKTIVYEYELYSTTKKIYDTRKDEISKTICYNYILDSACIIN